MRLPYFLDKDDYLQNPIMRMFLKEHNIELVDNRADYINAIEKYSEENEKNREEVKEWITKCAKEGSKEICFRKITDIEEEYRNSAILEQIIIEKYSDCPKKNIVDYTNTKDRNLIDYKIVIDYNGQVEKIEMIFSSLMLSGNVGEIGEVTILPVFVDIYLEEGMIFSRVKAKSTLFYYREENQILLTEDRVDTMDYATSAIDSIIRVFGFKTEVNKKIVKKQNAEMFYGLYEEYTVIPEEVKEKVNKMHETNREYVDKIFKELELDIRNKEKAMSDMNIFLEKFVAINGNNESVFKEDREAYLVKVAADDEIQLTKIDTASAKTVPLQCTEIFYDSKKSVINSKACGKLIFMFKRKSDGYLKNSPLPVLFGTRKNYGFFKTIQYAEEVDIQNVIQAVCKHFR